MTENNYPHKDAIEHIKTIPPLISMIEESKEIYIKENLSQHLHTREIELLRKANSHSKPHHKEARIIQYKKLLETLKPEDNLFELHKNSFIKRYQKLEKKGLVEVNTECEDLPYDVTLTEKGNDIIEEIKKLENEWNDMVLEEVESNEKLLELLKQVIHKAVPISHKHKKQTIFTF